MTLAQAGEYRKAIVAAVGVLVTIGTSAGLAQAGDVGTDVTTIVDAVLGLLTVFGVFKVPNATPAAPPAPAKTP